MEKLTSADFDRVVFAARTLLNHNPEVDEKMITIIEGVAPMLPGAVIIQGGKSLAEAAAALYAAAVAFKILEANGHKVDQIFEQLK